MKESTRNTARKRGAKVQLERSEPPAHTEGSPVRIVWEGGKPRPTVAIFGGGITGLTAAHELIERGFAVEVYEMRPASPPDQLAGAVCAIGGVAATQWGRISRPPNDQDATDPLPHEMQPTEPTLGLRQMICVNPADGKPRDAEAWNNLKLAAEILKRPEYENINVEVQGYCAKHLGPFPPSTTGRLDQKYADTIKLELGQSLDPTRLRTAALGLGQRDDWSVPAKDRAYVILKSEEDWLPGEHGFRFYPSFYRNLFDTMGRIPIPEDREWYVESPRTVLDNIVPTRTQGFNFPDNKKSFIMPRRPPTSAREFFDLLEKMLSSMDLRLADISRFLLKIFKYMTSCPARRAAEYEHQSWWDFLEGEQFSPGFQHFLEATPQTLVAQKSTDADARTFGNISVQMLLDQITQGERTDGTFNGPTTLAWFDHWRRYLETQGVEFYCGTLDGFVVVDERTIWPKVSLNFPPVFDADGAQLPAQPKRVLVRDYYLVAIGAEEIQDLIKEHNQQNATPLCGEDFERIAALQLGNPTQASPGGQVAHMSGIQFFFESEITAIRGHTDYTEAPWGLSSISQPQFWTRKRGWWDGYRGILSVDICTWNVGGKYSAKGKMAWQCTRDEIAKEVWDQIKATVRGKIRLPRPIAYHLDRIIHLDASSRPAKNASPFLLTRVGVYPSRPGRLGKPGYNVNYDKLVFAGPYMQTYTRMTTMEAANESARHAVNAILRHSGFQGARCSIADPEKNEPLDLKFLVELDKRLLKVGLPHFTEILDLREVPRELLRPEPDLSAVGLAVGLGTTPNR